MVTPTALLRLRSWAESQADSLVMESKPSENLLSGSQARLYDSRRGSELLLFNDAGLLVTGDLWSISPPWSVAKSQAG
jgi:hypothetical protein